MFGCIIDIMMMRCWNCFTADCKKQELSSLKQLFSVDGPIMTALGKIADFMILSILWLVCCVPVITAGAATAALYYVTLKMARGEVTGVSKLFFKALKENMKAGIAFTLVFALTGAVLCLDYTLMLQLGGAFGALLRVVFMALGVCSLLTMLYTFPLQAQFVNTVKGTLTNAFTFALRNLRITLLVLGVHAAPLLLIFLSLENLLKLLPLLLLLLPSVIAFVSSLLLMKVFKPMMELPAQ